MRITDKTFVLCTVIFFIIPFFTFAKDSYNYKLPDFRKIEVSGNMTVILEKRSSPGLYVELKNSSIDDLNWYVSVNTLILKKKSEFPDFSDIKIIIYYNDDIESVLSKNRALVKNIRTLSSDKLMIEAVSGGIIDLTFYVQSAEVRSVRTSRISLKGKCTKLFVLSDSGSEINSFNLITKKVQAFARSGGVIRVFASESIEGSSGLGSHIYFKGSPVRKLFTSGTGGEVTEVR